ncbi:alpha/beta fold hydrolase [Streptomyces sp. CWNU-52B]|uniref:alpha/beta fold hydrolase n=1 Tax=unclassified Streptomyces TaxID=2593676 RepID=UPI0039C34BC6
MVTTHTLDTLGAHLYYEVRGSGPFLVITGAPTTAVHFSPLADALAAHYTVVTHDPRGISRSTLDDPEQDSTPELRADDIVAILDDLGVDQADVFGSSGGGVTGFALVTHHPARVRTLVAHEPTVLNVLPDAVDRNADVDDVIEVFHQQGLEAAFVKFHAVSGMQREGEDDDAPAPPPQEPSAQDLADSARYLAHELRGTTAYAPDLDALKSGPARVVIGVGRTSGGLLTDRIATALTERLGSRPAEFPGGHAGFLEVTEEFAEALRKVLAD